MSGEMVRNRAGRGACYLPYTGSNAGNPIIPFGWLVSNTEILSRRSPRPPRLQIVHRVLGSEGRYRVHQVLGRECLVHTRSVRPRAPAPALFLISQIPLIPCVRSRFEEQKEVKRRR